MPCCVKLSPRLAALREMRARRSPGARGRAARGAGGAEPRALAPTPRTPQHAHGTAGWRGGSVPGGGERR